MLNDVLRLLGDPDLWLLVGAIGFAVGALAIAALGGASTPRETTKTVIHAIVCLIAMTAYLALLFDVGRADVDGDGLPFNYARYIDWGLTTPLLLLALAITATPLGHRPVAAVAALLFADIYMIVTGGFAEASAGYARLFWYAVSTAAFVVVLLILWGPLRELAERGEEPRASTYKRHAATLSAVWLAYPVVYALGPGILGWWGAVTTIALFTALDLIAKVGYGLLAVLDDRELTEIEARHRPRAIVAYREPGERAAEAAPSWRDPSDQSPPQIAAAPAPVATPPIAPPVVAAARVPHHRSAKVTAAKMVPVATVGAVLVALAWPRKGGD